MKMVKIICDEFIKTVNKLEKAYSIYRATGKAYMRNKYTNQVAEIIKIMNKGSDMGIDWEYDDNKKCIVFEYHRSDKDERGKVFDFTSHPEIIVSEFLQRIK